MTKPVVLLILDGWGVGENNDNNPIYLANTPNMDYYFKEYPTTVIGAAQEAVGLTPGHQGSTEIGHYIIGAGRNVLLPQGQVMMAVKKGTIKVNPAYTQALDAAKASGKPVHFFGLLQHAGVHAYIETCYALLGMAADRGLQKVYLHICLDGRDSPPNSGIEKLQELKEHIAKNKVGQIATVMGRWWAMDRDHRWERVEVAYNTMVRGEGKRKAKDADTAITEAYLRDETDEFVEPTVMVNNEGRPVAKIEDGDVVINFNFRVDREIEISQAFIEEQFQGFTREVFPKVRYVGTTEYYEGMPAPAAFPRVHVGDSLSEVLSRAGIKQFKVTETEKWPYMTKVLNCMHEDAFEGEDRVLIPSDKVATYDLAPKMQAQKIAAEAFKAIESKRYDFIAMNVPNGDMLGHAGVKEATIAGVESVDTAVGRVAEAVLQHGGVLLITADHGNAELFMDPVTNTVHTQHTISDIPFIVVSDDPAYRHCKLVPPVQGALKDIAPTILRILGIEKPEVMTGNSLIIG